MLKTHPCSHSSESLSQLPPSTIRKPPLQEVDAALNINHPVFLTQSVHQSWVAIHSLTQQLPLLLHNSLINHRAATTIRGSHSLRYHPHPFSHIQYTTVNTLPGTQLWLQDQQDVYCSFSGHSGLGTGKGCILTLSTWFSHVFSSRNCCLPGTCCLPKHSLG